MQKKNLVRNIRYFKVIAALSVILGVIFAAVFLRPDLSYASENTKRQDADADIDDEIFPPMDAFDATIWPVQDTPFQFDGKGLKAGTLAAGTPGKVIAEKGDSFYVRVGEKKGFVKKNVCMINLPDVMQKEMQYDITNSYDSIFKIHGKSIKGITGETFYPYVKLEDGRFLVPLLYPVALKLYEAEDYALDHGCTFKIYDAYRPNTVTKQLYAQTDEVLTENEELKGYVTEGGNKLGNFLANGVSNHNYGVAVDLTLVDMGTGEELEMQTAMHELSPLASPRNNTYDADMLAEWMGQFGFSGINTEWWHFEIKSLRQKYASFQAQPYAEENLGR